MFATKEFDVSLAMNGTPPTARDAAILAGSWTISATGHESI